VIYYKAAAAGAGSLLKYNKQTLLHIQATKNNNIKVWYGMVQ